MFFDGFPGKGVCPAGDGHAPAGFNFVLPHGEVDSPTVQQAWRFCSKCQALFFDGFPTKMAFAPKASARQAAHTRLPDSTSACRMM
jgi:hypothetical protein